MPRLTFDISMSLDGFIAGPNQTLEQPLGEGGEQLHEWGVRLASWRERHGMNGGETGPDDEVVKESLGRDGAVLMGRRMFRGTTFTFVTDGLESAVEQARAAAGDKDVSVAGGANVIQQCLRAGLVDEFQLHVVPVLLGSGVRLFDDLDAARPGVELARVVDSPAATHLKYRVERT